MQSKVMKKGIVTDHKTPSVCQRYCRDCLDSEVHATGSTLWVSCKLQNGTWRDINSTCNLPLNQKQIILYTSKGCSRCRGLKAWLRRNNLSFVTKSLDDTDIMTDLVMRNQVILLVPILEIENRVFLSDQIFGDNNHLNPDFIKFLRGEPSK